MMESRYSTSAWLFETDLRRARCAISEAISGVSIQKWHNGKLADEEDSLHQALHFIRDALSLAENRRKACELENAPLFTREKI